MRADPMLLRLRRNRPDQEDSMLPERVIVLQIRGMTERLSFEDGTEVVLGRYDVTASPTPRLDLSHYGARERGVSREHALLHFERDQLTIIDLKSVNGTTVNRTKLAPNKPQVIRNGDEITLGTLSIVVRFEPSADTRIIKVPEFQRTDDTNVLHRSQQPETLPETVDLGKKEPDSDKPSSEVS
jgi:pSer/pThr/pTyr-binding forkhead associated (FHA) protein